MTKYTYAERVAKKVKKYVANIPIAYEMTQSMPSINLDENFCLAELYWVYFDYQIIANNTGIVFKNGHTRTPLLTYDSFDSFLSMKL